MLNRPDFYSVNPQAGQLDISLIYKAVNTVIGDLQREEDFRVCEQFFDPDSFTGSMPLPADFKKLISVWYVDSSGIEVPPELLYMPFNQALAYRYTGDGAQPPPAGCPQAYVCSIFGTDLRVFPAPAPSETGKVRMYYYRYLPRLSAQEENYFSAQFPGYLTEAGAVHILKTSVQPRGDNSAIYDFERLVNNLKKNILGDERESKGTIIL